MMEQAATRFEGSVQRVIPTLVPMFRSKSAWGLKTQYGRVAAPSRAAIFSQPGVRKTLSTGIDKVPMIFGY